MVNNIAQIEYEGGILQLRVKLNLFQEKLTKMLGVSFISTNGWKNDKYASTKLVKFKLIQII